MIAIVVTLMAVLTFAMYDVATTVGLPYYEYVAGVMYLGLGALYLLRRL